MNRAEFIAGTLATIPLAQLSAQPAWTPVEGGQSILRPFSTAPFPHSSRAAGHTYQGKLYDMAGHYNDSTVGIFVPPGYVKKNTVDFVIHFHGWNNNVADVFTRYRLREQLAHSNVNAILVVPQGPLNAPDSADGKLENDPDGLKNFVNDVLAFLGTQGKVNAGAAVGNVVLSAHSGGYGGLGGALLHGGLNDKISDVMLWDALYAYIDPIAAWANLSADKHLISVYTKFTADNNTTLAAKIHQPSSQQTIDSAKDLSLANLPSRKPVFLLATDVLHDEIMQKYNWFELFLQTTALKPR